MAKFLHFEECPKCVAEGRDRAGDNLGRYNDGSAHCYSCGHHIFPTRPQLQNVIKENDGSENKAVLPVDFSREVPAAGWKWLLQYGLPYTYWKPYTGYSEKHSRLVLTFGNPVRFSIGRSLEFDNRDKRKWRMWGDGHRYVEILGRASGETCVLVEDLISAHKVAQVTPSLCLFGTNVHDVAINELMKFKGPVVLWLDGDQYPLLPKKMNKLQTFLKYPVRYVTTNRDPKEHTISEIKDVLSL